MKVYTRAFLDIVNDAMPENHELKRATLVPVLNYTGDFANVASINL